MIWPSQNHLQRLKGNRAKSAFAKYVHVGKSDQNRYTKTEINIHRNTHKHIVI